MTTRIVIVVALLCVVLLLAVERVVPPSPSSERVSTLYICNDAWFDMRSSDAAVIVVETHKLDHRELSLQTRPFVLVTANNDDWSSCNLEDETHRQILALPQLRHWYGTFAAGVHPKFSPIPLGPKMVYNTTVIGAEDTTAQKKRIAAASLGAKPVGDASRSILLYTNFNPGTTESPRAREHTGTRLKLLEALQRNGLTATFPQVSFEDYMRTLGTSVFCVSPPGRGTDAHRTWEALHMGCIPIVLHYEPLMALYEGLPVLVVRSWDEITADLLRAKRREFSARVYDMRRIDFRYWETRILETA